MVVVKVSGSDGLWLGLAARDSGENLRIYAHAPTLH